MIADRVIRVGSPYDFTADLPVNLNQTRVDSRITADSERDDTFKSRVQSAILQIEAEAFIKIFPGRFIAQWTQGKIQSHGNCYRPLTLPSLMPQVIPQGSNNQEGNPSMTNVDLGSLLTGTDSTGNLEVFPTKYWPNQDITIEFTAGIPNAEAGELILPNPYIRQLIAAICRYSYWQDKEDNELVQFLTPKVIYASRDAI